MSCASMAGLEAGTGAEHATADAVTPATPVALQAMRVHARTKSH